MKLGISYKTVSEVRNFTTQDVKLNPKVYITDVGKEGEFIYDSSDTSSSDNLGTILVAGTARYKRVFSDFVEPSWFYTSGSYSSAIQTSLSFGKKVFIKSGTYLMDSSINVPSNSVIIGEGKSTIIKLNANNLKAFNISGLAKSNITIKDLAIDGSGQTTDVFTGIRNSFGVYATNVTNLNLDNLYIYKMGIVNQSNVIDDNDQANDFANPTGGYGILVEAREGIIENILIEDCKIENIAGGGNIFGDGVCVQGFNTNLNIIPKNIIIKDCYVSEVARHCYSVAGGGGESLGNDVKIINCFGKNAALCGVDIEDGNNVILENSNFESCGITNSYYNPNTVYGSSYNLRAGISYANSSNYLFFTNVKVKNSYYGLTVGAGGNIIIDNLIIEGSVTKDIELGLARWGENISINNSKFLSNTTNSFNLFNSNFDSFIKFNNCYFVKSPIVSEIRNLSFENCTFNEKLLFVSTGIKRIKILNNTFNSDRGIETNAINQFIEDLEIHNNLFNTTLHGIYILYDSFIRTSIKGNTFKGGIGIFHNNANGNTPFDNISENKFIGCTTGIDINQGIKDAVISKNTFKNISNWCINIHDIITASPTDVPFTNNIISHNIADSTCVNGLQVYASTGKILNSIFNYNLFDKCTNVDYNIVADFIDDISQIWKKSPIVSFTIDEVRAFKYSDVQSNKTLFIKDKDKEGFWEFDSADGSSTDNIGTILVTTSGGYRYKRKYKSDVYASWFIDTADTTGTSGNRERNAINRAVIFALAQTVCPTVILDNKRTWYVNNSAIYLDVATGKKIAIKGEGNPIIDFTCTGANEDGTSAVFRTSNSWSYPITAYNTANGTPVFTGSITGETLTITAVTSGSIKKGMRIYDATNSNIMPSTKITEFLTGTGGTGTYKINKTQTFSSGTITGQAAFLAWNNRTINTGEIEINGITFDGSRNPANNGSNTIYSRPILLRQSEKVEISNCEFKNIPGSALAIGISDGITIKNNKFSSVFARNDWDNIGDAITIYAFCKNINVSDNKIELSDNQSGRCGISFDDFCKNGKVVNNEITGYERAIHIETSKNIVTANNTTEKSPVGILSGGNEYCTIENNSIDGTDVVFPATLSATANLFVYYDLDCSYNNNIVVGTVTTQNSLYNSKFWGDKLSVRGNLFKNPKVVNDFTNSTTSTTSNTIGTGSKTFTYTSNSNLVWKLNQRLRIKNSTYVFVEGYITSVSSTSVTITVDLNSGSGTYTSWTLEYAPLGGVWGYGYNNDNVYEGNVFEYANLQVDSNNNTVVKGNIFKSCAVTYSGESATRGVNGKIIENTFIPNAGETFSQGITVYNAVKPYVADNVLENPTEYVIQNTGSTGGVFENNTYIKTNVGAAGNGYFFVDSNLQDTNPTRTVKPNIIRDYVTSTLFYVDNHGLNYEIDHATPEMFGARVNDSTFNSGAAINAAIAFKKKVKLKAGTYYSTEKILINRNDFILEGEGKFNTVIQTKSGFSGSALVAVGSAAMQPYDVTIKNLRINANASGTGTNVSALEIEAQYNIDVDNCWMQGGDYNGTLTASVNVKLSKHLRFTSCNFTNGVSYGVMFSGAAYDDTMFNDCQFDENQVDIIVLSTGYVQRGNILGCSFGQSYVNGTYPTPVVNKNIYAGTASTIDYLSVINCDFFSSTGSSTDNAIDIISPIQLRISESRFSNLKKYAIVNRDSGKLIVINNSFINNGRSRSNGTYTNATTNPDTSPYMTDIFSTSAFYGGSISGNTTDQTVVAVVEIGGSTLTDQNITFSDNLVYSFGTLWGASTRNIGGNEINLKTGGSATNYLNEQGDYTSISGGGDALTSGTLAQFAATTSAQLAGVISDETGTGSLVFANSPTLVTPNLGTPSAINLTNATSIPAGQLTGTIPSGVLGNSTVNIGTTAVLLNRASGALALTGITSIDGFAAAVTLTADNTTNATNYPLFANAATGNLSPRTDTGFTYNPSTGVLTSTTFAGALSGNATTATTLQTGRTINGTTFDGSANITITAAAGTLTGTTLNATVTGSSLTSVGTITSGTWSGSFGAVSGANLTNLTAANLTGTIPSAVLGNSSHFIGTTSVALNRASANQALTGILSVQLAGATSGTTTIQPTAVAGTTTITFPAVTGTVITTGDTSTVTNTMLAGSIANAKLANNTISGVALGSNLATLTIGTGLTGTSYNGSGAVSIAIDSTVVTLSGSQTLTNKTLTNPVISSISNSGTITIPTGTDTIVGRATTDTLTNKRITARVQSTTSTATFTFNFDSDDIGVITAQAAGLTVTTSGTPTSMQPFVLCVKDNGTARAITWNGIFVAIGVTLPTTTVVNKHTYVSGYYNTTAAKVHIVGVTTES